MQLDDFARYIESMPERCQAVIAAKGEPPSGKAGSREQAIEQSTQQSTEQPTECNAQSKQQGLPSESTRRRGVGVGTQPAQGAPL